MKQYLIFLIVIFSLQVSSVSANWYGPALGTGPIQNGGYFIENKNVNSGATWCSQDNDTTGGFPPVATWDWGAPAPNQGNYIYDSRAYDHDTTRIRCQRWDAQIPELVNVTFTAGWVNSSQTITVSGKDRGGSTLKRLLLQQRLNSGTWGTVSDWDNLTAANNTIVTQTWVRTVAGQNGNTFEYRVIAYDYAGNSITYTNPNILQIDTMAPVAGDITNPLPAPGNLLASNSQNINVTVGENGGSPISEVRGYFENYNVTDDFITTPFVSSSGFFNHNFNISNVDRDRETQGYRNYRLKITRICDSAGNCLTQGNNSTVSLGISNYGYSVYANTLVVSSSLISENISNTANVADGTAKNVILRLRDTYGNIIIPATGIQRTIDFNITASNDLRLNQYNNNGTDSALFAGTSTTAIPIGGTSALSLNNRSSTTGDYTLPFYIFAPTNNTNPEMPGQASISGISFDVNRTIAITTGDNPTNVNIPGISINVVARPLYTSVISGEVMNGFIEGGSQDLDITMAKSSTSTTSSESLRVEFGGVSGVNNIANPRYSATINGATINEGNISPWSGTTELAPLLTTRNNNVFLMVQDGVVSSQTLSYFATIVKYVIGGKTIIYPADILGKDSYHGSSGTNNSYQTGVKIIGDTSSQNTQSIVTNSGGVDQFESDVRILGKLTKPSFRRDIQEKVYNVIKDIPIKSSSFLNVTSDDLDDTTWLKSKFNTGDSGSLGTALFGDKVLYFGYNGTNSGSIIIEGTTNIEGEKTIVIKDRNVYITGNIRNTDNDGILGIVVLNGNIFIAPGVTDIHAILYTDKSIMSSSNGVSGLDGNTSASTLANQLYIRGSVFSENTIGASRSNPAVCPYTVPYLSCNQVIAQMYDLNFLRRYYMYDADVPADGIAETPSGAQSFAGTASQGSRTDLILFPLVIEYDSTIQQTPPPFFD